MVEPNHPHLSINRQCALLGLSKSSYYYQPALEDAWNLELMERIDKIHLQHPYYGCPRMCYQLRQNTDRAINHKRVARLMRKMRIRAVLPRPKTTVFNKEHRIYPYLLRNLVIKYPNHVWSTDITYLPMRRGFMYLTAVIDWYSRYVLSWELSNNMERWFCMAALRAALEQGQPEIFNTDQGSQFTSNDFTDILQQKQIKISMDGKGRALDNVFVERLWWSVKYEKVYLNVYESGKELYTALKEYFDFYNNERPHSSLGMVTPADVYFGKQRL